MVHMRKQCSRSRPLCVFPVTLKEGTPLVRNSSYQCDPRYLPPQVVKQEATLQGFRPLRDSKPVSLFPTFLFSSCLTTCTAPLRGKKRPQRCRGACGRVLRYSGGGIGRD